MPISCFVGVYEAESILQPPGGSDTGTVGLCGRIGSLIPEYFANPQGGVTLQASIPVVPNAPVPEPSTWALLLLGLAASAAWRRRLQPMRGHHPVARKPAPAPAPATVLPMAQRYSLL